MCILANIFSTHHELGLSGKVTRFLVRNILEVVRNGGRETLRRCILGSASGAQEPNSTIMQNIMKTFHRAMKIRKYLRLSRNSRMLSPGKSESIFTSSAHTCFHHCSVLLRSLPAPHPLPPYSSSSMAFPLGHLCSPTLSTQARAATDQPREEQAPSL